MPGGRSGLFVSLSLAVVIAGCKPHHAVTPGSAVFDRVVTASFDSSTAGRVSDLPPNAYRWVAWWNRKGAPSAAPAAKSSKVDSVLAQWVADSSATKIDTLVVTYVDHVAIPRFPEPDVTVTKAMGTNPSALVAAEVLTNVIAASRSAQYTADSLDIVNNLSGAVLERYWITQALRITLPLGSVDSLASRPGVVWIQRDHTGLPPPGFDTNPLNDPKVARDVLHSDLYRALGIPYGWISVLDTGVNASHELFAGSPSPFDRVGDCVDGDASCSNGNPHDITRGHGTATAAILSANNELYPRFMGVTSARLDVFRVYRANSLLPNGELVVSAALRGFQNATAQLDRVIVAEMQDTSAPAAAIADAADGAFDAGATVIAANGNFGPHPPGAMSYPACARRVVGIGARSIMNGATTAGQSYGKTADGRQKPEMQVLTSTETAGSPGVDATYSHGGTSGATPYAAGSAALLRNWLTRAQGSTVDPGQVYAQLILSGLNRNPPWPEKEGVGELALPLNGFGMFGKIELTDSYRSCDIPVVLNSPNMKHFDVALWWPEENPPAGSAVDAWHNDIDVRILDPGGVERARSDTAPNVFERAGYDAGIGTGTWKVHIDGKQFRRFPQVVYWTVALRYLP